MRYLVKVEVLVNARTPKDAQSYIEGRIDTERGHVRNARCEPTIQATQIGPDVIDWPT